MDLTKQTILHFSTKVSRSVASAVATFFIARLLGADTLGAYAVVMALLTWMDTPTQAIAGAINKRVSEGYEEGEIIGAGIIINVMLTALLIGAIALFRPQVNDYLGGEYATILMLLLIGQSSLVTVGGILNGSKQVVTTGVIKASNQIVRSGLQIWLLTLGMGIIGLFYGHIAGYVLPVVSGVILFSIRPKIPSYRHFYRLYRFARYAWLNTLTNRTYGWMDTLILAFFVQDSLIGIYELSWNLASMLALLSISIQSVLFPNLSELNEEGKNEQIIQLINDSVVYTTLIMIPGLVGAAVIGSRILRIYAPEFTMGQYILIILVFSRLLASVGDQFLNTLNGIDRPDTVFRINALLVSSNLSLNVILIWQFGWYGAAVASLVSAMVPFGLGYRELRQSFSTMEFPKREIGYQTVAAVMMGIIVILFDNAMPIGNYVTLLITVSGAIVYAVVLLALSSRIRKKAFSVVPKSLVPQ